MDEIASPILSVPGIGYVLGSTIISEIGDIHTFQNPAKLILWIGRSGSAWRDLPERYGSWKTVYSWFCKWRDDGTLVGIFKALNAEADYENLSIDSTVIKAHQHMPVQKKGCKSRKQTAYREKQRRKHDKDSYCG